MGSSWQAKHQPLEFSRYSQVSSIGETERMMQS
jgi:hypothetical protein